MKESNPRRPRSRVIGFSDILGFFGFLNVFLIFFDFFWDFFWISLDFQWFLLGFGWKLKKINEILRKSLPAELPQPVFQTSRKPQTNQFPKQSNSIMKKR
jgi:hypothetical protein